MTILNKCKEDNSIELFIVDDEDLIERFEECFFCQNKFFYFLEIFIIHYKYINIKIRHDRIISTFISENS